MNDTVSGIFLNQLGVRNVNRKSDESIICKYLVDLYDSSQRKKDCLSKIKSKVIAAAAKQQKKEVIDPKDLVGENTVVIQNAIQSNSVIHNLQEELKDYREENAQLKQLLFGVKNVVTPLQECFQLLLGDVYSHNMSFEQLVEQLHNISKNIKPSDVQNESLSVSLQSIEKCQKEIILKLNEWEASKTHSEISDAQDNYSKSDLQLTKQIQSLNASLYDSMKELVLFITNH